MLTLTQPFFPRFSQRAPQFELEHVLPQASLAEVTEIERSLGIALPDAYKQLLQCARGFWLMGGVVQFGKRHLFFHEFERLGRGEVAATGSCLICGARPAQSVASLTSVGCDGGWR